MVSIKISDECAKLLGVEEGSEVTAHEIYHKIDNLYKKEDADCALSQREEIPIGDENGEYSEEEYETLCEEIADKAIRILEKSDSFWDSYWMAFDFAISEVMRQKDQLSMF